MFVKVVLVRLIAPGVLGNISVNETPVAPTFVGLERLNVNTLFTFTPTTSGKNDLLMTGDATVRSADAALELLPPLLTKDPAGMMLL